MLFLSIPLPLLAPTLSCVYVRAESGLNPFEKVFTVICEIESGNDSSRVNMDDPNGGSWGIAQIGQLKLDEYNAAHNTHHVLKDLFCKELSRSIFMFHCMQFISIDTAIKRWNGSGKQADDYLKRVKSKLWIQ